MEKIVLFLIWCEWKQLKNQMTQDGPPADMVEAGGRARVFSFVEHLRCYSSRAWALSIITK